MHSLDRRQWLQRSAVAAAGLLLAPGIRARPQSSPARRAGSTVFLDSNENPYGPSARAQEAMQEALVAGNRYPERAPLAETIARATGLTPEHVALGHGSFELLCTAALAFVEPGGEVVTPDPSFNVIADRAERRGARARYVPLTSAYALDLEGLAAAVNANTDLVYVCNPNNPTGTIVPDRELRPFCEAMAEQVPVVVDEAYHGYVESADYASLVDLVREGRGVVVLRTFSKIHGLAGMRVGYALARPDLAARLRAETVGILNTPGLAAARAALADEVFVAFSRQKNAEARAVLCSHLDRHGLRYADSHASFVWVDAGGPFEPLRAALDERGFRIGGPRTDPSPWGRITVGMPEDMHRFGDALASIL